MSFDIDWSKFDVEIADKLKDYLNDHIQTLETPEFLGSLRVDKLDFGTIAPQVEIVDIRDPEPEFLVESAPSENSYDPPTSADSRSSASRHRLDDRMIDTDVRLAGKFQQPIHTTAGISRAAVDDTFHTAQRSRKSVAKSEVSTVYPWDSASMVGAQRERVSYSTSPPRSTRDPLIMQAAPKTRNSTDTPMHHINRNLASNPPHVNLPARASIHTEEHVHFNTLEQSQSSSLQSMVESTQVQVEMKMKYDGNMFMKIKTELIVNQPTPRFMVLPVTLTLTKFYFQAHVVVAMVGHTVNFCFKKLAEQGEANTISSRTSTLGPLLQNLQIDTEIGDEGKQVLRNVKKIERFIVEQVHNMAEKLLTFPSFYSVDLFSSDPVSGQDTDRDSDVLSVD